MRQTVAHRGGAGQDDGTDQAPQRPADVRHPVQAGVRQPCYFHGRCETPEGAKAGNAEATRTQAEHRFPALDPQLTNLQERTSSKTFANRRLGPECAARAPVLTRVAGRSSNA